MHLFSWHLRICPWLCLKCGIPDTGWWKQLNWCSSLPVASGKCQCSAQGANKRRENFSQGALVGVFAVCHSDWTRQGYSVFLFYLNQMGHQASKNGATLFFELAGGSVLLFYLVLSLICLKILISALLAQKCFLPVCCFAVGCCCLPQRKLHFCVAMWI